MANIHPDRAGAPTPSATPSGLTPSARKRPVSIPWREVARRLAEGEKPAAIASGLGLDEDRIWRHLRKSLRFRSYLHRAIERQRQLAGLLLEGAGLAAMVASSRQPEALDGGVLRCLLDEVERSSAADMPVPAEISKRIERLGETGAPLPNMAFRRRMAEEKRLMDLQVATWRIQDTARAAATARIDEPQGGRANASEPERTETNANEHERSETNTSEARRSETNANEAPRAGTGPRPRPPALPPELSSLAIIDIDGPDRARLAASGALSRPALPARQPPDD